MIDPESTRPTDNARAFFQIAKGNTRRIIGDPNVPGHIQILAFTLELIAEGIESMAVGMRATYIKLEKIEQKLDRQR